MQFLYPSLLWALLALAIPIIIHLFHFRRFKKVYFTNVKFLKEIKEEKSTRNKLRNLLVLLSRLLAMAFLIFAFAQPFIAKNNQVKKGINKVSIFIDNSFSMLASSEDVPLMDKAKKKAEEIVAAYNNSDEFQILTHELKGVEQRWLSQETAVQAIDEIESNPKVSQLSQVWLKQQQSKPEEGNHIIYYLSDFQKSIVDLSSLNDTTSEVNLVPFQAVNEGNVSIDSAWFESVVPSINQNNKLFVRFKNHSKEEKRDLRLSIEFNGQKRPEGTIDIPAEGTLVDTINLLVNQPGWQEMKINIEDYPIQFDNAYFIQFNIKENIKVLSIDATGPNKYLKALFAGLNQFSLEHYDLNRIQYDKLKNFDLVILNDLNTISSGLSSAIEGYLKTGGNALVFPSRNAEVTNYNNFFSKLNANSITSWSEDDLKVYKINTAEFVFSNVYSSLSSNLKLPSTKGNFSFTKYTQRGGETLLEYRNGQSFISKYNVDQGKLYVCAAPLDNQFNDLTVNAEVFVPLLYKLSFSTNQGEALAFTIGKDSETSIKSSNSSNDIIYKIKGPQEFIPGQSVRGNAIVLSFNNMISEAGFYDLNLDNEKIKGLAFNYDRVESKMEYLNNEALKEQFGEKINIINQTANADLGNIIKQKDQGISLWRWCLILALIFLAIETLLLRFWKI